MSDTFYKELKTCLDKGMTLQYRAVSKFRKDRVFEGESVLGYKRTDCSKPENLQGLWGDSRIAPVVD